MSKGGATELQMANAVRALAMDAVQKANSGHPGMPMGMADAATVLWTRFLKYDAADPAWPDRDRFVLSAGHGSMLIYALLHLSGSSHVSMDDIRNFRQLGSKTPGHPEYGDTPGVETTTGPLGQGIATAVGMAIAERHMAARYGEDLVDHRTYVIASDGDLMEGISHEAIGLAGHLRLNRLIVLFDDNAISIDGPLALSETGDQIKRFEAAGWRACRVDGHDHDAVAAALEDAQTSDRPVLIACRTIIGFGAPSKAGKSSSHGAPLGEDEIAGAREALGWSHAPFTIPDDVAGAWAEAGRRGCGAREAWEARAKSAPADFHASLKGELPKGWRAAIHGHAKAIAAAGEAMATRVASGKALEPLCAAVPDMVGGSADLTGSNNTRTSDAQPLTADNYAGRFIHYGVREHGMAAAMNGMALHGGMIPFSGTFLVFSDYCRPSIRLAALMKQRVIHVMTHDSIGLGEDGPTHQPVEHLAALRAMPGVRVFRPCDAVETAECWELALDYTDGPSVMALTRQKTPASRAGDGETNRCARGAYVLSPAQGEEKAALLATGSEVSVAMQAQVLLAAKGVGARVVSMPCWELFEVQDEAYQREVLGEGLARVGVEAACGFGWDRWLGARGAFIGMTGFGASAPAPDLYKHFGITADAVAKTAQGTLCDAHVGSHAG